jgi:hypothetical protein
MPTRRPDSVRAAAAASALAALHLPAETLVTLAREQREDVRQRARSRAGPARANGDAAEHERPSPAPKVEPP